VNSNDEILDKNLEAIGQRLKELRIEAGYSSYVDFAIKNNMQPKQYWKLEAGKTNFTIRTLLDVLRVHGISLSDFFSAFK